MPGWSTTEADGRIELWQSGYQGVPAAAGEQFAELAANEPSELYQDLPTVPGALLAYAVSHRGRDGVDTMQIQFGPPGGAANFTRDVTTGNTGWQQVMGTYRVPAGQTLDKVRVLGPVQRVVLTLGGQLPRRGDVRVGALLGHALQGAAPGRGPRPVRSAARR